MCGKGGPGSRMMKETQDSFSETVTFSPPVSESNFASAEQAAERQRLMTAASVGHHLEVMRLLSEAYNTFKEQ